MLEFGLLTAILLVFYLYLLVRWQHVRRPMCYLVGAAALMLVFVGMFFAIGHHRYVMIVTEVLAGIGNLAAFVSAVFACYGGKLPLNIAVTPTDPATSG